MPRYSYDCPSCQTNTEISLRIDQIEEKQTCPTCQSQLVREEIPANHTVPKLGIALQAWTKKGTEVIIQKRFGRPTRL